MKKTMKTLAQSLRREEVSDEWIFVQYQNIDFDDSIGVSSISNRCNRVGYTMHWDTGVATMSTTLDTVRHESISNSSQSF